jgi:hypothetical protein
MSFELLCSVAVALVAAFCQHRANLGFKECQVFGGGRFLGNP